MDIADRFKAIVVDQWGVLHNGTDPYPGVVETLHSLNGCGLRLAVLSNSGKRISVSRDRITRLGIPADLFDCVMTSGEALWIDIAAGRLPVRRPFVVAGQDGDAQAWAEGLRVTIADDLDAADAIVVMGLRDGTEVDALQPLLQGALDRRLPLYCSNPDRASPRADGRNVTSPGAVADRYRASGGKVVFYGKPHRPIFDVLQRQLGLPASSILMVGDSLEHDVGGAHRAGWSTAFVRGGLHRNDFATGDPAAVLDRLTTDGTMPDYSLELLN